MARPACSRCAHGEGFLGMRYRKGKWYYDVKNYDLTGIDRIAMNSSYSLVTMLCESIVNHFKLPLAEGLTRLNEINKKHFNN
jgi:hypothetical protein